jgi:hypothetical protein
MGQKWVVRIAAAADDGCVRALRFAGGGAGAVLRLAVVVTVLVAGAASGPVTSAGAADSPIGAHSMLQLNDPYPFMQAMFAEAAAMHASTIRLDVAPAIVFGAGPGQPPDFSGLDEVVGLAQQYHLQVVGDLMSIPWWIADCQTPADMTQMDRCGTDDLADYGSIIRQIVARSDPVIRYWEVWNEPDSSAFFTGTVAQYAYMLRTAHDAVKAVDPADQVLLGGISSPASMGWLGQVLATPGADAAGAFDIANIHERGPLGALGGDVSGWRQFLGSQGFTGPIWVTEHGYPSDPAYQYDPGYGSGPTSQAAYLQASIPTLLDAGAAQVFVTERDNLSGPFASEGVLGGDVADPPPADPQVIEKPAYAAVRALAACYLAAGRDCPQPAPVAAPGAVVLPATRVGATATATVTVADSGAEPTVLGAATLTGPGAAQLAIAGDGCSQQILEPTATCTMSVRYSPVVGGAVAAELDLGSPDGEATAAITVAPAAPADLTPPPPARLAFRPTGGADGVGYPQQLVVPVANQLPGPVGLQAVGVSGGQARAFSIAGQRCAPRRLFPGQRCSVTVRFMPRRTGIASAMLSLRGAGRPLQIALTATAFPRPALTRLTGAARRRCRTDSAVVALADQPAALTWRISAYQPPAGGCRAAPGTAPLGRSGRVRTATRPGRLGGTAGYPARLSPWRGLRPGHRRAGRYRLTVTPVNQHGTGRSRTVWITLG